MATYRFLGVLHDDPLGVEPVRHQLVQLRQQYGDPAMVAVEADRDFHFEVVERRPEFRQMLESTLRGAATPLAAGQLLDQCTDTLSFEGQLALELVAQDSVLWLDHGRRGHSGSLMAFRLKLFKDALSAGPQAPLDRPWSVDISNAVAALATISAARRQAALQAPGIQGVDRDERWFNLLEGEALPDANCWIAIICGLAHATQSGGDWTLRQRLIDNNRATAAFYPAAQPPANWYP